LVIIKIAAASFLSPIGRLDRRRLDEELDRKGFAFSKQIAYIYIATIFTKKLQ